MNNQEVINFLDQVRKILLDDKSWLESTIQPINEAFNRAISALQAQDAKNSNELSSTHKALDTISRQAAINTVKKHYRVDNDLLEVIVYQLENLPSAQPEWNNHTVACLLAELFDDTCACNYNGIDEWLPRKCELLDSCPNPVGVACWEQYLKHRAERRTDDLQ